MNVSVQSSQTRPRILTRFIEGGMAVAAYAARAADDVLSSSASGLVWKGQWASLVWFIHTFLPKAIAVCDITSQTMLIVELNYTQNAIARRIYGLDVLDARLKNAQNK